ncbi:uncharacterized protein LOC133092072 [Eubalaena glacialis]|uniref:uncharacterized protein LOC133092072 n=1 Tax=Eubalaena glacialis TaxID=27606 RepID=UPI002A5A64D5|nr:uncharacterized protein LOC133092072 [Eubalaena glacialis]
MKEEEEEEEKTTVRRRKNTVLPTQTPSDPPLLPAQRTLPYMGGDSEPQLSGSLTNELPKIAKETGEEQKVQHTTEGPTNQRKARGSGEPAVQARSGKADEEGRQQRSSQTSTRNRSTALLNVLPPHTAPRSHTDTLSPPTPSPASPALNGPPQQETPYCGLKSLRPLPPLTLASHNCCHTSCSLVSISGPSLAQEPPLSRFPGPPSHFRGALAVFTPPTCTSGPPLSLFLDALPAPKPTSGPPDPRRAPPDPHTLPRSVKGPPHCGRPEGAPSDPPLPPGPGPSSRGLAPPLGTAPQLPSWAPKSPVRTRWRVSNFHSLPPPPPGGGVGGGSSSPFNYQLSRSTAPGVRLRPHRLPLRPFQHPPGTTFPFESAGRARPRDRPRCLLAAHHIAPPSPIVRLDFPSGLRSPPDPFEGPGRGMWCFAWYPSAGVTPSPRW